MASPTQSVKEESGEDALNVEHEIGRLNAILQHANAMRISAEDELFEMRVSLSIERRYNEVLRDQREELQRKLGALQLYCDTWTIIRWEKWIRSTFPASTPQPPARPTATATGNSNDWDEELAQIEASRIKLEKREKQEQ